MIRAFEAIGTLLLFVTTTDINANSCSPSNYDIFVEGELFCTLVVC